MDVRCDMLFGRESLGALGTDAKWARWPLCVPSLSIVAGLRVRALGA